MANTSETPRLEGEHVSFQAATHKIREKLVREVVEKLGNKIIHIAEQTSVSAIKTCEGDSNCTFLKSSFGRPYMKC